MGKGGRACSVTRCSGLEPRVTEEAIEAAGDRRRTAPLRERARRIMTTNPFPVTDTISCCTSAVLAVAVEITTGSGARPTSIEGWVVPPSRLEPTSAPLGAAPAPRL